MGGDLERHAAFVDIHCHLLPELDDGAENWIEAVEMARIAVDDGITHSILTPHQLGGYRENTASRIRQKASEFRRRLQDAQIKLHVAVGGDVRIEPDIVERLDDDEVLTLADRKQYVLLELPHELYFPLEPLLERLQRQGLTGVLSHPERNQGILANPTVVSDLVDAGCLMQLTAGSVTGAFGPQAAQLSEAMLRDGLVHVVATDAHGINARRPRMSRAYETIVALIGQEAADQLCCSNPRRIFYGELVQAGRQTPTRVRRRWFRLARST